MRVALALLALTACVDQTGTGPAEVKFDRDACEECRMVISDRRFAAQVRGGPNHAAFKFDDVGCAVRWLSKQPWADQAGTKLWVARLSDGAWVDARGARYEAGKTSPMGYGFGAVETGGVGFDELQRAVRAFQRPR